ncbi:hypothetical protein ACQR35_06260 [Pseudarthrobacter sp. J1738]|uniref:hypothetical protein n=1 Tax=unclassified Pseudarthrobacter TaxID=2647000 RepID=UPI003D289450
MSAAPTDRYSAPQQPVQFQEPIQFQEPVQFQQSLKYDDAADTASQPTTVPVLPAVDLNLGTVTIWRSSGSQRYWCAEPKELARALNNAVAQPGWDEVNAVLTVRVAAIGHRRGKPLSFTLKATN